MAAMSLQAKAKISSSLDLISDLKADYPEFKFKAGQQDHWSPDINTVIYDPKQSSKKLQYGILHELSHAILEHNTYQTDIELLKLEAAAWDLAAGIGKKYRVKISDDHIQTCLNTYRDWLHKRSTCPECGAHGLQKNSKQYSCLNCQTIWRVSSERFLRCYRIKTA